MALNLINEYVNVGNADVDNVELVLDKTRKGFCAASLTEWGTTTVPAIAGGSVVEIDGGMFEADGDEALGGSPSNGLCYIKLIPEPIAGLTATAELTNDAPVWDDEKQGWYSSAPGEGNCRYLPFVIMKADALYYKTKIGNTDRISAINIPNTWQVSAGASIDPITLSPDLDILSEVSGNKIIISKFGLYKIDFSITVCTNYNGTSNAKIYIKKNGTALEPQQYAGLPKSAIRVGGYDNYETLSINKIAYLYPLDEITFGAEVAYAPIAIYGNITMQGIPIL